MDKYRVCVLHGLVARLLSFGHVFEVFPCFVCQVRLRQDTNGQHSQPFTALDGGLMRFVSPSVRGESRMVL